VPASGRAEDVVSRKAGKLAWDFNEEDQEKTVPLSETDRSFL
jgi:hypothetical protein